MVDSVMMWFGYIMAALLSTALVGGCVIWLLDMAWNAWVEAKGSMSVYRGYYAALRMQEGMMRLVPVHTLESLEGRLRELSEWYVEIGDYGGGGIGGGPDPDPIVVRPPHQMWMATMADDLRRYIDRGEE